MSNSKYLDSIGTQKIVDNIKEKADKTEIPTTLPANGGNSDTVGNYAPEKLIQSNPNLLDNPDFKINQRGKSTATGGEYIADRWKAPAGTVTRNSDNSIKLSATGTGQIVLQQITETPVTGTMTLTMNIKSRDNSVWYAWLAGRDYLINGSGVVSITATTTSMQSLVYIWCQSAKGGSIDIAWMKLELGSVATPFVSPNPAEELVKCQRYYQVVDWEIRCAYHDPYFGCFFPEHFEIPMRVAPSIILPKINDTMNDIVTSGTTNQNLSGWLWGNDNWADTRVLHINLKNSDTSKYSDKLVFFAQNLPIAFSADL